jgi:hypothetical protein
MIEAHEGALRRPEDDGEARRVRSVFGNGWSGRDRGSSAERCHHTVDGLRHA